jgi:hypothetical protein
VVAGNDDAGEVARRQERALRKDNVAVGIEGWKSPVRGASSRGLAS